MHHHKGRLDVRAAAIADVAAVDTKSSIVFILAVLCTRVVKENEEDIWVAKVDANELTSSIKVGLDASLRSMLYSSTTLPVDPSHTAHAPRPWEQSGNAWGRACWMEKGGRRGWGV